MHKKRTKKEQKKNKKRFLHGYYDVRNIIEMTATILKARHLVKVHSKRLAKRLCDQKSMNMTVARLSKTAVLATVVLWGNSLSDGSRFHMLKNPKII